MNTTRPQVALLRIENTHFKLHYPSPLSPVPGLPLTPPWEWAWTQAGKERVLYYLQAHARNDAIFPPTLGENHIWKEIPNLGIVYSQCFYTENIAGKLKLKIMMPSFWRQLISQLRNAIWLARSEHVPASNTGLSLFPPGFRPVFRTGQEGVLEQDFWWVEIRRIADVHMHTIVASVLFETQLLRGTRGEQKKN